jgi:hypothetical protein
LVDPVLPHEKKIETVRTQLGDFPPKPIKKNGIEKREEEEENSRSLKVSPS